MTAASSSDSHTRCPLCSQLLATWVRINLHVKSCESCFALFFDRGELFKMFRAEGYRCPPEALLRASFVPGEGEPLPCPHCSTLTLEPGALEGCEVWHCTPCNGFLVEPGLVFGTKLDRPSLRRRGFERRDRGAAAGGRSGRSEPGYLYRVLQRLAFWAPSSSRGGSASRASSPSKARELE